MSHVTKLNIAIRDMGAVQSAVAELIKAGKVVSIVENQKPRVHGYDTVATCDYVIKLAGAYDVGLKKNAEGLYEPILDVYQGHVGKYLGAGEANKPENMAYRSQEHTQHEVGLFLQTYAKYTAMNAAMAAGHVIESCGLDQKGNVQLVLAVA